MPPWVFDATPLIYLANVDRIALVQGLDGRCLVPRPVYEEVVVDGVERGYPDARRLERAIDAGRFEVVAGPDAGLASRLRENPTLSDADASVLACAADRDGVAVMDERVGREATAVERIDTRGTAYLVCSLAERGEIDAEAARETIDAMIEAGWYCAPNLYAKLVRVLESVSDASNAESGTGREAPPHGRGNSSRGDR